ncbi:phage tail protein [Aeromonas veronii]|uniref:phage tail-collar fiber domain-containing protein n=1 Tax=Aeromonas veronii TaxID=654 RepID=UPI003D256D3F
MSQVITNAFEQYWQSSLAAEQPVVLDEFILADIPNLDITSPIDPDTGLPPESQIVHRQNVDQRGRINNNAVAYTIVMDTTVGDFSFNAMYLRNKQNGVIGMIVYKGRETKLKTDQTTGQTGNSLVKSMLMGYDQAAETTLTNVDAGTWQIDYAARLRGQDEDLRQLASQLYGHHTFIGDGFKVVQQDGGHQVTQGVAIVGGLRIELKQPEVIYPGTKPIGVWVDVHRSGSLLSEHQNHFTIITSVADLADHVDSNGYPHYVAKLGTVQADSTVIDGRGQGGSGGSGAIPDTFALWKRSMAEAGYDLIGQFGTELTIETADQVLLSKDGTEVYAWQGALPKDVPDDATLEHTGGIATGAWKRITGELLRNALAALQGKLTATPAWPDVPQHSNPALAPALDAQAQALLARSELLKASVVLQSADVAAMLAGSTTVGVNVPHAVGQRWSSGRTNWKLISTPVTSIANFEAIGTLYAEDFHPFDGTDANSAIRQLVNASDGVDVKFPLYGRISISETFTFTRPKSIDFGHLEISFNRDVSPYALRVGEPNLTLLGTLSTPLARGSHIIQVSNAEGLVGLKNGDKISIYNPTDFSWISEHYYFRQAEFNSVDYVYGSSITTNGQALDDYPAGCQIYAVPMQSIPLTGRIVAANIGSMDNGYALTAYQLCDCDMSGLRVAIHNATHGFQAARCWNLTGDGVRFEQFSGSLDTTCYGLAIAGCQNIKFHGHFRAERHGSSIGGDGSPGQVINRFIHLTGEFITSGLGGAHAADCHSTAEYVTYGGYIEGATLAGGPTTILPGSRVVSPVPDVSALYYGALKSTDHRAKDIIIEQLGNPNGRGVIDVSGNSQGFLAATTEGGMFDFEGSIINAPNATYSAVAIRNRGSQVKWGANFKGMEINQPKLDPSFNQFQLSVVDEGAPASILQFDNDIWQKGVSGVYPQTRIEGVVLKGTAIMQYTETPVSTMTITYPCAIPGGRIPTVSISTSRGYTGAKVEQTNVYNAANTGFKISVNNNDNSALPLSTATIQWRAEL